MGSTNGRAWTWTKKAQAPSVFPRFRTLDSRFSRDPGEWEKPIVGDLTGISGI